LAKPEVEDEFETKSDKVADEPKPDEPEPVESDEKEGKLSTGAAERKVKAQRRSHPAMRRHFGLKSIPAPASTTTPEEKHASELKRLNQTWNAVFEIFGNTSLLAVKKEFVKRLADDLDAEIRFAGEVFAPSRVSLNSNPGPVALGGPPTRASHG
jgi:hypothetical protein